MRDRRKIVTAGRLWVGMLYRAVYNAGQDKARVARSQITTPARESINARTSWQKLLLLLAANFSPDDVVATLTYRDEALPALLALAKEVIALGRLYGYDGKEMDA